MQDYISTCVFLVYNAIEEKYQQQISVSHTLGNSIFFNFQGKPKIVDRQMVKYVQQTLNNIVNNQNPENNKIIVELETKSNVLQELNKRHRKTAEANTRSCNFDYMLCARYNNYFDVCVDPMITQISDMGKFVVKSFEFGFIVTVVPPQQRLPQYPIHMHNATVQIRSSLMSKDIKTVKDAHEFLLNNQSMDIRNLDKMIQNETAESLTQRILVNFPMKRIICVCGPQCGGKTTFSSKLAVNLSALGYPTHVIGTHLFQKDYQILSILIKRFFSGDVITIPKEENGIMIEENISPTKNSLIILDGIDSIDPRFLNYIEPLKSIKIYTGPHSPIHFDNSHSISSVDICLIRIFQKQYEEMTHFLDIPDDDDIEPPYLLSYLPNFDFYINTFSLQDFNYSVLKLKLLAKSLKKVDGDENWYETLKIRKIYSMIVGQKQQNSFTNETKSSPLESIHSIPQLATL